MSSLSDLTVMGAIGLKDECGECGVLVHDGDKALFVKFVTCGITLSVKMFPL